MRKLCNRFVIGGMFAGAVLLASTASAQFLVDPAGGTVLFTSGDDDSANGRALGFTGNFFGTPHTTVDVCTNGYLSFNGDTTFSNGPMPGGSAHINALFDDLFVYGGQSITEKAEPGVYYSATWQVGTFRFGHVFHEFQVVWFGAAISMRGFDFQPDDIVLCYKSVGADPWDATVGLDAGGGTFVPLPGDADGFFDQSGRALLPVFPTSHKVILFRPNGAGGYVSMKILTDTKCRADFNSDGVVNSQDFFDFLTSFFGGC